MDGFCSSDFGFLREFDGSEFALGTGTSIVSVVEGTCSIGAGVAACGWSRVRSRNIFDTQGGTGNIFATQPTAVIEPASTIRKRMTIHIGTGLFFFLSGTRLVDGVDVEL